MKYLLKKPVGLAAAIVVGLAAMTATNAATVSTDNRGDLAIIPYYTTNAGFITGIHITNTTNETQIVKVRFRRGSDSDDALDFIVGLSPRDMFTGYIKKEAQGITFYPSEGDNSCTIPALNASGTLFPSDRAGNGNPVPGGDEGYVEIIGMGTPTSELASLPASILHTRNADGSTNAPQCATFRENFHAKRTDALTGNDSGVLNFDETAWLKAGNFGNNASIPTKYKDMQGNALRVSYFIRDNASGLEFGNSAVHIENFATLPMMANQEFGIHDENIFVSGETVSPYMARTGYNFPNLNGGSSRNGATTANQNAELFETLRAPGVLGTLGISNDWSVDPQNQSATDWVVTFPGQYLMRPYHRNPFGLDLPPVYTTDDLPVTANVYVWDRNEGTTPPRGLVVSPNATVSDAIKLKREVNVVEWFNNTDKWAKSPVLKSSAPNTIDTPVGVDFKPASGWAEFRLASDGSAQAIYDHAASSSKPASDTGLVPAVGFVAWNRQRGEAAKRYGRIVEHGRFSTDHYGN